MEVLTDLVGQERAFTPLAPHLRDQLRRVPPSRDHLMKYRPCRVVLRNSTVLERVYVAEAAAYVRAWEVWPEEPVPATEVVRIEERPWRLPARLADKMYAAGETAMGGCLFVVAPDGRRYACETGNAVDFPGLPEGVDPRGLVDLLPHEGRDAARLPPLDYRWCLYARSVRRT
jgi:hypothetical protein